MPREDWKGLLGRQAQQLPAFDTLDDQAENMLYLEVRETLAREERALAKALDDSLSFVPRLLRGSVKKLVGV
mgnify:CR=1 FL=1